MSDDGGSAVVDASNVRYCRRQRAALSLSKGAVARRIAPTSAGTLSLSSRPDTALSGRGESDIVTRPIMRRGGRCSVLAYAVSVVIGSTLPS